MEEIQIWKYLGYPIQTLEKKSETWLARNPAFRHDISQHAVNHGNQFPEIKYASISSFSN